MTKITKPIADIRKIDKGFLVGTDVSAVLFKDGGGVIELHPQHRILSSQQAYNYSLRILAAALLVIGKEKEARETLDLVEVPKTPAGKREKE